MKIFNILTERKHRPALIIGLAVLVYMWFFSVPHLWTSIRFLVRVIASFSENSLHTTLCILGFGIAELLCMLANLAIWLLSIVIIWLAFQKSKKKAYIFLLAYFLLPLVIQPTNRITRHIAVSRQIRKHQEQQAEASTQLTEAKQTTPIAMQVDKSISLPVGELLLLAGVWYLYKKEEQPNEN